MVQQCIAKVLKSYLCWKERPVPLVHDLGVLLAKLDSTANLPFSYELTRLNEFAGVRRYEEGRVILTIEEADDVLEIGRVVVEWGKSKITNCS